MLEKTKFEELNSFYDYSKKYFPDVVSSLSKTSMYVLKLLKLQYPSDLGNKLNIAVFTRFPIKVTHPVE